MVSTARHHGLPSPPGQKMQGALFTQWTPDRRHSGVKPNTTHLDSPTPLELKDCLGLLGWGGEGEDVPTFGQLLLLGVGLEAGVGLANRDVVGDVFSPSEVEPGPPVCTNHPMFLSRSAHGISPVTVRKGEILLLERGVRDGGGEGRLDGRGSGGDVGTWGYAAPHAPGPRLAAAARCAGVKAGEGVQEGDVDCDLPV